MPMGRKVKKWQLVSEAGGFEAGGWRREMVLSIRRRRNPSFKIEGGLPGITGTGVPLHDTVSRLTYHPTIGTVGGGRWYCHFDEVEILLLQ